MATDPNKKPGQYRSPDHSPDGGGNGADAKAKWVFGLAGFALLFGTLIHRLRSGNGKAVPKAPPITVPARRIPSAPPRPIKGHEKRDANAKWIFLGVGVLFLIGLTAQFAVAALVNSLKHVPPSGDYWEPGQRASRGIPPRPAYPLLQISPPADLLAFREKQEAELNTYGWINKTSGIVRIPIEQGMDLVLKEGLPVRSNASANLLGPSSYQLQWQRPEHREPEIQGEK